MPEDARLYLLALAVLVAPAGLLLLQGPHRGTAHASVSRPRTAAAPELLPASPRIG